MDLVEIKSLFLCWSTRGRRLGTTCSWRPVCSVHRDLGQRQIVDNGSLESWGYIVHVVLVHWPDSHRWDNLASKFSLAWLLAVLAVLTDLDRRRRARISCGRRHGRGVKEGEKEGVAVRVKTDSAINGADFWFCGFAR